MVTLLIITIFTSLTAPAHESGSKITNADRPAIKKLLKEDLVQAFMTIMQSPDKFRSLLAKDVKLRWIKKISDGKDAFIETIVEAFKRDAQFFVTAASNYKFLVTKCGITNKSQRPVGLPESIDITKFDPKNIRPEDYKKHPGLMAPWVRPIKDLQGRDLAANRYIMIAEFKHSWMKVLDRPYTYIDRWIMGKRNKNIKIVEYEFTANIDELPSFPTEIKKCPSRAM